MISVFDKVSELVGVGSFYKTYLSAVDVSQIADLLWLFPRKIFRSKPGEGFNESDVGREITLNVSIVVSRFTPKVTFVEVETLSGQRLTIIFFKSCSFFRSGAKLCISGILLNENDKFQMKSPRWKQGHLEELIEFEYRVDKIPNGLITKMIHQAIELLPDREDIDEGFLAEKGLVSVKNALKAIHDGCSTGVHWNSIAFAELLAYKLGLMEAREAMVDTKKQLFLKMADVTDCLQRLDFDLTNDQKKAWGEILWDLTSGERMLRMLYGDVGSGKTIAAILAALLVYRNGKQAAILAPTQILATQHYELCKRLLPDVEVVLLTTATKTKANVKAIAERPCIIIGTHALLEPKIKYYSLSLLVIDEHHKFGVLQRLALTKMGLHYHLLIMSATPIPRTLKLLLMDNIQISRLLQRPQNHRDIKVSAVYIKHIEEVYAKVRTHLQEGDNVFWICPFIKSSELKEGMDVATRSESLQQLFGDAVMVMHGQMKTKNIVLDEFKNAGGRILVSTTVVEVGVNIPHANLMIIENAENFGLAQLYQLLGRVGRGAKPGECCLVYSKVTELAKRRFEAVRNRRSGMEIAEADMAIRGYGDILGTDQIGHLSGVFKVFDPDKHLFIYDKVSEYMQLSKEKDTNRKIPDLFKSITNPWSGG